MLSKFLIQFSVAGQGCVPALLFDLRPDYGGDSEDNGASFKRSHRCTAALSAPAPVAGHCGTITPQETLKHSSGSVYVGPLCPGAYKIYLSSLSVSGGYGV